MIAHFIWVNADKAYFEEFSRFRDYYSIYLMLMIIMMARVFWSITPSSDQLRKLRIYGIGLFIFSLFSDLILTPLLILIDNFIPQEFPYISIINVIYYFLHSLITSILAIKTIQYGSQAIGWIQSDNHTELYAQPT